MTDMFPATLNYQEVCIFILWAASMLTCSHLLILRLCVFLVHEQHSHSWYILIALTPSGCVIPFHELHHCSWLVLAFNSQQACIFMSFHAQLNHGWHVSANFDSQQVCISISWTPPSQLTCSHHFQLLASVYFHFVSCIIMADMLPPLSTLSKCVFIFHELHHHGWHIPPTFNSQAVCNPISFVGPSGLTCSCHFQLSGSV